MKIRFAVAPHSPSLAASNVTAFADALEASGFDGVWLSDLPFSALLDPLLTLAVIAGRTRRLKLGTNIVVLGRNPFMLAKSLAQLDQISGGRLLLSFMPGLNQPGEREALGLGPAKRGDVLEEMLGEVRHWWSDGERANGAGPALAGPAGATTPIQDPLEVWLGGLGPKALDRVGRIADGWLAATITPAESRPAREAIQRAAEAANREFDPEHFGISFGYARWTRIPPCWQTCARGARTSTRPRCSPSDETRCGR